MYPFEFLLKEKEEPVVKVRQLINSRKSWLEFEEKWVKEDRAIVTRKLVIINVAIKPPSWRFNYGMNFDSVITLDGKS